jgi:hypothetical protein
MTTLSYAGFHLLFVLPPLAVLAFAAPRLPAGRRRVARVGLLLMTTVALLYTTPWDNYLIRQGVWWYGEGTVLLRLGDAPLEEYLFFVLQPVLTGLWLYIAGFDPTYEPGDFDRLPRVVGALVWLGLSAVGALLLSVPGGYYLGAILVWACPIVALQWAVGATYLLRTWRRWGLAVAVPTVYLWFADRVAIGLGIWTISDTHSTGLLLLGLPIEEAVFFLVTNVLVVQGLVLFEWVIDKWRRDGTI